MRTIFHVDMDAFFVSVEELFDPSLKGKPVVVGGPHDQRGVVSAASYAARKFGVHSAMPLRTAYQRCPQAIFVEGHPERYRDCSKQVFEVLGRFSPKVEMASIDEAYLDVTGTERLFGPPLRTAHTLHESVKAETGLNCSVGIGTTRMVAKVVSDCAKPNGVLWVAPGLEAEFLSSLDIRKIPGVGKKTEQRLNDLGIRRVGDLARLDVSFLESLMGKWGLALIGKAQGLDAGGYFNAEVAEESDPKSISHEQTFAVDSPDPELVESTLAKLAQMVARRLREHEMYTRTIQIKLRYSDFETITRAVTLDHSTQIDIDLIEYSRMLLRKNWSGAPVRLIGVQAGSLESSEGQLSLIEDDKTRKWRGAVSAMDRLRDKFGEKTVAVASGLKGVYEEKVHENPADLHGKRPKT